MAHILQRPPCYPTKLAMSSGPSWRKNPSHTHFVCSYFLFPASAESQKELNTLHNWPGKGCVQSSNTCVAAANEFNSVEDDGEFTGEHQRIVCHNLDLRLCGVECIYIVTAGNKEVLYVCTGACCSEQLAKLFSCKIHRGWNKSGFAVTKTSLHAPGGRNKTIWAGKTK